LVAERRGAHRAHHKGGTAALGHGDILGLRSDERRHGEREPGIGTDYASRHVRYAHRVSANVRRLHPVARITAAGGARQIHVIEAPLITERRRARRADGKHRRAARVHRLILGLSGNPGRQVHREHRHRAGDAAGHVDHQHRIIARIAGLHPGAGVRAAVGPRDIDFVAPPLVAERGRPAGRDGKQGGASLVHRLALGLGADCRRHVHRQHRVSAGDVPPGIGHHHRVVTGIARLNIVARITAARGTADIHAIPPPLVAERCGAGGADGERGGAAGGHLLILRLRGNGRRHHGRGINQLDGIGHDIQLPRKPVGDLNIARRAGGKIPGAQQIKFAAV